MNRWLRFAVFSFAGIIVSLVIIALITPGGGIYSGYGSMGGMQQGYGMSAMNMGMPMNTMPSSSMSMGMMPMSNMQGSGTGMMNMGMPMNTMPSSGMSMGMMPMSNMQGSGMGMMNMNMPMNYMPGSGMGTMYTGTQRKDNTVIYNMLNNMQMQINQLQQQMMNMSNMSGVGGMSMM